MEKQLEVTSYQEILLIILEIGIVSTASFLDKIDNSRKFSSQKQIIRLTKYNLIENRYGKIKCKAKISKRSRKKLRSILYKRALVMVAKNNKNYFYIDQAK